MIYHPKATMQRASIWTIPAFVQEANSSSPGPGATGTAFSDYLENKTLDHILGKTTFTAAATLYYALYTAAPTDTGVGGTEVTGGSYARISKTNNTTEFPNASSGAKSNGTTVNFGTASADWGTIGYIALFDASSAGNMYFWGDLSISIPIQSGDSLSFPAGNILFQLD